MAKLWITAALLALGLAAPAAGQDRAFSPAAAQLKAQALRAPAFTFENGTRQPIASLRLKSAERGGDFGPNLLQTPLAPGEKRALMGLRGTCAHVIEVANPAGRTIELTRDICADPAVRLSFQSAARPPAAAIDRPAVLPSSPLPPATIQSGAGAPQPQPQPQPQPVDGAPVDAAASAPSVAAEGLAYCAIVEERLPPAECARLASIERGTGAFKTPERMKRGESATVILAISRDAGSSAPSEAIAGAEGREGRFRPAVGRYIEAKILPEPGLKVEPDPATPELQDLYAGTEGLWRWTITAEATGEHQLTLRTRVMTKRPDGSFAPRGQPFVDSRRIAVYVEGADAIVDGSQQADKALGALTGTTDNLAKLVAALTALLVAFGGLWLAFRRFGKAQPKAGDNPEG